MSASARAYRISPLARQDLEAVWQYTFQTWSSEQADTYNLGLIGCFRGLAASTKKGRRFDNIRPGYKVLGFQSHFIVYRETDRLVTIIRVLHRRMNIANHL